MTTRVVGLLLFLMVAVSSSMHAQTVRGWFTSPSDGAAGISVNPTITIRTSHRIDTSSVTWTFPWSPDSGATVLPSASKPMVILMKDAVRGSFHDSLWNLTSTDGELAYVDDSTLTFTPAKLHHGTKYAMKLTGLKVRIPRIGQPDSIATVPDTMIRFTTVALPSRTVSNSIIPATLIRCSDTLRIQFSAPLSSTTTSGGDVVQMFKEVLDSTSPTGITRITVTNENFWLSPSDSSILLGTVPYEPGANYVMDVRQDLLTGDPLDRYQVPFGVRELFKVSVDSRLMMGVDPLIQKAIHPRRGYRFFKHGDTAHLIAAKRIGPYEFKHWECIGDPTLHLSPTATLSITYDCKRLGDVSLIAVYDRIAIDSISITAGMGGNINVTDDNGNPVSGVEGKYPLRRGERLHVFAVPDPGFRFASYATNISGTSPTTFPILIVQNNSGLPPTATINAGFTAAGAPPLNQCAFIARMYTVGTGAPPANMVAVMTPSSATDPTYYESSTGLCGPAGWITVNVTDPAWVISAVHVIPSSGAGISIPVNGPTRTEQIIESMPHHVVMFELRRRTYELRVEKDFDISTNNQEMLDNIWVDVTASGTGDILPYDGDLHTTIFHVDHGVLVKLAANSNPYYKWLRWETTGYTDFAGSRSFSRFMDRNRSAKAVFEAGFYLLSIGVHDDPNDLSKITYFDPNDVTYKDNLQILPGAVPNAGTEVILRFNMPVDLTRYYNGSVPKIRAADESDRIDHHDQQDYHSSHTMTDNTLWRVYSGNSNAELRFTLRTTSGIFIPKMEVFKLFVNNDLLSTTGAPLKNGGYWRMMTEMPGLRVKLTKIWCLKNLDWDPIFTDRQDYYTTYMSGYSHPGQASTHTEKGRHPYDSNNEFDRNVSKLKKGHSADYDKTILDIPQLHRDGKFKIDLHSFDADNGRIWNAVGSALEAVAGALGNIKVDSSGNAAISIAGETINGNWLSIGATLLGAIGKSLKDYKNPHDLAGSSEWFGEYSSMFLCKDSNGQQVTHEKENDAVKHQIKVEFIQ